MSRPQMASNDGSNSSYSGWFPSSWSFERLRIGSLVKPDTTGATPADVPLGSPRKGGEGKGKGSQTTVWWTRSPGSWQLRWERASNRAPRQNASIMDLKFGEDVNGTLESGETRLFHTEEVLDEQDLEIHLIVHKGNADLYVVHEPLNHPPSSVFNTWKGDYGSGDELVFVSSKHNDFKAGKLGISVVGRSVESEWTLRLKIFNETRNPENPEKEAIEEIFDQCCNTPSACRTWESERERVPNVCYIKGNFCSSDGHVEIFNVQSDGLDCPFPQQFGRLSKLRTLQLKSNSISGAVSSIADIVSGMRSLERLLIADNELTGELPCNILSNDVHSLDLASNEIRGNLPECLSDATNLQELNLDSNRLEGSLPALPLHLATLRVSDNFLSGDFPDVFRSAKSLDSVAMARNRIGGAIPANAFPDTVQELRVANNFLSGELPEDLFQLPNLKIFSGAFNQFSERLPASTFLSPKLVLLDLRGNRLEGLPTVYKAKNLGYLDIAMNCVRGTIPEGFQDLDNLQFLYMQENAFSGRMNILTSDAHLLQLRALNISYNALYGPLPTGVDKIVKPSNSTNQHMLDVSGNFLNGSLPEFFSDSTLAGSAARGDLTVNLRRNFFSCPLPSHVDWIQDLQCSEDSKVKIPSSIDLLSSYQQCRVETKEDNSISSGAVAGIVLALIFMCVVLGSLGYIAWQHHKSRKERYLMNLEEHIELHEQSNEGGCRH